MARHVLIHANAGHDYGMGHLMRSIAIAQEAIARGWAVTFGGDIHKKGLQLIRQLAPSVDVHQLGREQQSKQLKTLLSNNQPDVVHLDTYAPHLDELRGEGFLLSNVQDGSFGARPADVAIDPNLGATAAHIQSPIALLGSSFALIREQVRKWRRPPHLTQIQRLLVVMGGTDPFGATPAILRALDQLPDRLSITAISPESLRQDLKVVATNSRHHITQIPFADDLPALIATHDLVISAAGTSVWDIACLGIPMALVWLVDNQRQGYDAAIGAGIAHPLGRVNPTDLESGLTHLAASFANTAQIQEMAQRGFHSIDGKGSQRVLEAWNRALTTRED